MAYKFVDVTIVVFLFISAIFAIISCAIPEWSRRENKQYTVGNTTQIGLERIGLWRTCVEVGDIKNCDDTAHGDGGSCFALLNASRVLNVLFFTFSILGAVMLLVASAMEKRWMGAVTVAVVVFTMITGLACWACWLSFSSQASCGMAGSTLAGAFILMVIAFGFSMFFTVLAVFVFITTKGFGFDKDWSGKHVPLKKPYDAYHRPPPTSQPVTPARSRPASSRREEAESQTPDRSSLYRVQDESQDIKPSFTGVVDNGYPAPQAPYLGAYQAGVQSLQAQEMSMFRPSTGLPIGEYTVQQPMVGQP